MTDKSARRRALLWGFLAGSLMFVIGAPLPHSVLVALAIVATAQVLHAASIELHDRPAVPRRVRREGSRRELAKLTRNRGRRNRGTEDEAVRRLRAVAYRRLADLGVDATDMAQASEAERRLGPLAYGVLIGRTAPAPLPDRHFSRCVDVVEALAEHRHDREVGNPANVRGSR